jgi:hypothetical protein
MFNVSWQMNKDKDKGGESGLSVQKIADRGREGDIFPAASLDEYAEQARDEDDSDEEDRFCRRLGTWYFYVVIEISLLFIRWWDVSNTVEIP